MSWVLIAIAASVAQLQTTTPAVEACAPRPMLPAIDSAGDPPIASDMIEFAATPSLQHPARAWVVRLSRRGEVEATMEIMRLRRRENCNRYDVESRWRTPLRQEEYAAIAGRAAAVGVPTPDVFVPSSTDRPPDLVLDGTGIDLRLQTYGLRVSRSLNHYGRDGAAVSSLFRELVAKYVPASELPAEDWRTPPQYKE